MLQLRSPLGLYEHLAEICFQKEVYQALLGEEDKENGKGGSKRDLCVECLRWWPRIVRIRVVCSVEGIQNSPGLLKTVICKTLVEDPGV